MALLERIATLIRANINELIEKAEQPDTMMRQILLDMENQLIQVKTQMAISIVDQHVLEKRLKEAGESVAQWKGRAETALRNGHEALARTAAARVLGAREIAGNLQRQVEDQKAQVENFRNALEKLRDKLREAEATRDMLAARRRRSRALEQTAGQANGADLDRMKKKIDAEEAAAQALTAADAAVDDHFAAMDNAREIDNLLAEIRTGMAEHSKTG